MKKQCYEFKLYKLPYAYNALEPYIDEKTMHLHHDRHLKAYTDKLNAALKPFPEYHNWTLERLLCNVNSLPVKLREDVRNDGGGVYNHIYYFAGLSPDYIGKGGKTSESDKIPKGMLGEKIDRIFGSWELFKDRFKECAEEVFGSGYLWLAADRRGHLKILQTHNQDSPITRGFCPIFTIDLWEHAYYLKHYNDRSGYIDDWFDVLNLEFAEENYVCCVR
ncbi:MAG: superoxide dismutase [Oscillospiraceae bacterium]|nr:superoxide dismutase [Oscillospiraceae bacterium]